MRYMTAYYVVLQTVFTPHLPHKSVNTSSHLEIIGYFFQFILNVSPVEQDRIGAKYRLFSKARLFYY